MDITVLFLLDYSYNNAFSVLQAYKHTLDKLQFKKA